MSLPPRPAELDVRAVDPFRIDPFRAAPDGRYEDHAVVVVRRRPVRVGEDERLVGRTRHFAVGRDGGRLLLVHDLGAEDVDNDVAVTLAEELFAPGWAAGADTFERLFTGVVLTTCPDPLEAWETFYRNTLRRLAVLASAPHGWEPNALVRQGAPIATEGSLASFAALYRLVEHLVAGSGARSLLDLGSCFGFLPLRLRSGTAGPLDAVLACDISPGTTQLLAVVAERLGLELPTLTCDAACVPLPDGAVDVVTALHVLEHVDAAHGERILAEAVRVARRRVVVAVPFEDEPDAAFGHVRRLTMHDLVSAGAALSHHGWTATTREHHGGWLVLDRTAP